MSIDSLKLDNRWEMQRCIGKGSNGTVFEAVDTLTSELVAVKIGFCYVSLSNEIRGYKAICGGFGFPALLSSGYYENKHYIAMSCLGPSIADGNEKTVLVSKKAAPRRQSPLVKEVLEHYKHLFVGKSIEEKRKERPYLFLSQCDETFRNGEKVKDILGSDVDLIRKWCSKITR